MIQEHEVSERRACRALGVNRTVYRYESVKRHDEDETKETVLCLTTNFGRAQYRMVTNMMRNRGININHKRVERIWRKEGLKLPEKQTKRRRIFPGDGSCIRLRAGHGAVESLNGKFRAECLNQHWFKHLSEAREIIECWRMEYNGFRPHMALDYMTPNEYAEKLAAGQSQPSPYAKIGGRSHSRWRA